MKKKLVTVDNLEDHVCRASKQLHADGTMILTPGARDELAKRGVAIVYGAGPPGSSCHSRAPGTLTPGATSRGASLPGLPGDAANLEELLIGVAATLKNEYGVSDPQELKALSLQVVKTIKDNI